MNSLDKIQTEQWIKNWSGNWRTAFASLYQVYTVGLKPYTGENLLMNLLICEKGVSANYVAKNDLDNYGKYTAKLIIDDNDIAIKWAKDTVATAEALFKILNTLENEENLTAANLLALKTEFYLHIPPHFSMKKVVDYLPQDLQEKLIPSLTEARLKTENLFNAVDGALRAYTKLISEQVGYNNDLTDFLTIDEILNYLNNKVLLSEEELINRSNGLAIFCEGSDYSLLIDSSFKNLQKYLIGNDETELKGVSAYKGYAKGIVRIILDPFKVSEFNEGDILVTGMTRPEFLPLMQKASAFVTDAGGVLSHAAIVARELGKPCVLATQKATKILKDGDLIEVDGDKGIVRLLKKS